jgi:DNA-binding MarR family transcriptional regulator
MLSELFTKKNLEILVFISEHEYHIRDIADTLKCSPAKVHNAVKLFKQYGIVKEKQVKNKKIVIANRDSIMFKKIMELVNISKKR